MGILPLPPSMLFNYNKQKENKEKKEEEASFTERTGIVTIAMILVMVAAIGVVELIKYIVA